MGVDRYLTYKGEVIANCVRMHRFEDALAQEEIYRGVWRLIHLYTSDYDAFVDNLEDLIYSIKETGAAELLEYICEDDDMGVVDE